MSMDKFTTGVIISTYNNPAWLEKTLWGYSLQTVKPCEVIIADDGSSDDTRKLIEKFAVGMPLKHVWHEDLGFRKTKILNEALKVAKAEYLIFTDQDCVPRNDFVAVHRRFARKGSFLSGGYFKLPMDLSRALSYDDIASGRAFSPSFLLRHGVKLSFKMTKLLGNRAFASFMNAVTPARASWNGMNSSGWRSDIIAANGFDERMQYGGEDRELGERLVNAGIKPIQIRYDAVTLHLDHSRPYKNEEAWKINNAIRKETKLGHITRTSYGILKESVQ